MRKHNVYNAKQSVVLHTNIKFVRIDDEGSPLLISERVKKRYNERMALLSDLTSSNDSDVKIPLND